MDLDNTVMEAAQMLGSDQWFGYITRRHPDKFGCYWNAVQNATRMQLVEPRMRGFVDDLNRNAGVRVLALTARRKNDLEAATVRQLDALGIRFDEILYSNGVESKGSILSRRLRRESTLPSSVLFVDDKPHNVASVESALQLDGVRHKAFVYDAARAKVDAFDARIADEQLSCFLWTGHILSDSRAKLLRRGKRAVFWISCVAIVIARR